jgi:hypothetical protein
MRRFGCREGKVTLVNVVPDRKVDVLSREPGELRCAAQIIWTQMEQLLSLQKSLLLTQFDEALREFALPASQQSMAGKVCRLKQNQRRREILVEAA